MSVTTIEAGARVQLRSAAREVVRLQHLIHQAIQDDDDRLDDLCRRQQAAVARLTRALRWTSDDERLSPLARTVAHRHADWCAHWDEREPGAALDRAIAELAAELARHEAPSVLDA